MKKKNNELINNDTYAEEAVKAFKTDVKLAALRARIESGDLSEDEKAFVELLNGDLTQEEKECLSFLDDERK